MLCPYCKIEHKDDVLVCPNTGLPLGSRVACPSCGAVARPGASYCSACGATLPRAQAPIAEGSKLSQNESGNSAAAPAENRSYTRPSVSLVELSRRKTRAARMAIPASKRRIQHWAEESRAWRIVGYALIVMVLLAGAAGLYLVWVQLR